MIHCLSDILRHMYTYYHYQVNFDCSAMFVKDSKHLVDAFNVDPLYLKHDHQHEVRREWSIFSGIRVGQFHFPAVQKSHNSVVKWARKVKLWLKQTGPRMKSDPKNQVF